MFCYVSSPAITIASNYKENGFLTSLLLQLARRRPVFELQFWLVIKYAIYRDRQHALPGVLCGQGKFHDFISVAQNHIQIKALNKSHQ